MMVNVLVIIVRKVFVEPSRRQCRQHRCMGNVISRVIRRRVVVRGFVI
jgi:hypothetical protein